MAIRPLLGGAAFFAFALLLLPQNVRAQIDSNLTTVTLNAARGESLTVSVVAGSSVGFDITGEAAASGDAAVTIETDWKLRGSRSTLQLWGYFTDASAALTDDDGAGYAIPSANVYGRVATGAPTAFTAFADVDPFGGASGALMLFEEAVASPNHKGDRSDDLELQIDPSGLDLPGGDFSGTLTIRATAF